MPHLRDATWVAEVLAVNARTVHRLARAGVLPSVQVGRFRRFLPSEVRRFIEQRGARVGEGDESGA